MVVPFGFSIGDFIDTATLFKEITVALKDHGGAASDYQKTVKKLETIEAVLLSLKNFTPNGASLGQINAIRTLASTLGNNVDLFLKNIKRYEPDLGCRSRNGSHHGVFSKINWAQSISKEVSKLDESIAFHSSILQMLLGMQTSDAVSAIASGQQRIKDLITTEAASNTQRLASIQSQLRSNHHIQEDLLSVLGPMAVQLQNLNKRLSSQAGPSSTLAPLPLWVPTMSNPTNVRSDDRNHIYPGSQSVLLRSSHSMLMALKSLLALANSQQINDILNAVTTEVEIFTRFVLASVLIALREFMVVLPQVLIITRMMRALPRAMSLIRQDCIRFEDALGRIQILEYQHFRNWPVFEALIRCHFADVPGSDKVLRRQYTLINPRLPSQRLVAANWDWKVFPGMTVIMAIHVKSYSNSDDRCPRCSSDDSNSSWTAAWSRRCPCGLVFSRDFTMYHTSAAGGAKCRSGGEHSQRYVKEIHRERRPSVSMITHGADGDAATSNDELTEAEDETDNLKVFKRVKLLQRFVHPASTSREVLLDIGGNGDESPMASSFQTRSDGKEFFRVGRVFAMLWDGGATSKRREYLGPGLVQGEPRNRKHDNIVLRYVRMVVGKEGYLDCLCLPIETYNHQGVARKDLGSLDREDHAVIYMDDTKPTIFPEEEGLTHLAPIAVTAANPEQNLNPMSRVNFEKQYKVPWDVKVMGIGDVHKDHLANLNRYWVDTFFKEVVLVLPGRVTQRRRQRLPLLHVSSDPSPHLDFSVPGLKGFG